LTNLINNRSLDSYNSSLLERRNTGLKIVKTNLPHV
jgi:hypothetical protein